jgi:hypothetical protein
MYENEKENRLVEEDPKSTDSDRGGGDHGWGHGPPPHQLKKKKNCCKFFIYSGPPI